MARTIWSDDAISPGGAGSMRPARRIAVLRRSRHAALWNSCVAAAAHLARLVALWRARHRQRRMLAQLDARALHDIGVTRLDAMRECAKPFWR